MSKLNKRKRDLIRKKNKFKKSLPKAEFSARNVIIFFFISFVVYFLFIIFRTYNYAGVKKMLKRQNIII